MKPYNQSITEIVQELKTSIEGLEAAEAHNRLKEFGFNELQEKKKVPPWMLFLNQFKDFMIIVLIVAAILSGMVGDATDTIIILVIVLLNAIVGFVQEYKAEKAMDL
jgi:Ca2+-transporting ATPase